jgi:protein TonB
MRATGSAVSLTFHVALGVAVLLGTANAGRSTPARPTQIAVIYQPAVSRGREAGVGLPSPRIPVDPDVPALPLPSLVLQRGEPAGPVFPIHSPSTGVGAGDPGGWGIAAIGQEGPEVLTGPHPAYPDLLRQAGIQGHVVLEAVVDSTGRVLSDSILVVSASNPGFVAPARRALLGTLFRPARIGGRAVRMRVRVPFEFTLRSGTGRAR